MQDQSLGTAAPAHCVIFTPQLNNSPETRRRPLFPPLWSVNLLSRLLAVLACPSRRWAAKGPAA